MAAETTHDRWRRRGQVVVGAAFLGIAVATAVDAAFAPGFPLLLAFAALVVGSSFLRRGLRAPQPGPVALPAPAPPGEATIVAGPRTVRFEGVVTPSSSARYRSLSGRCTHVVRVGDRFDRARVDGVDHVVDLAVSSVFHEGRSLTAVRADLACSMIVHGAGVEHLDVAGLAVVLDGTADGTVDGGG